MVFFFFNDTATTEIYTLSLHDALPISAGVFDKGESFGQNFIEATGQLFFIFNFCRSEEHTSELQSQSNLVCRLLLEKKKKKKQKHYVTRTYRLQSDLVENKLQRHLHHH